MKSRRMDPGSAPDRRPVVLYLNHTGQVSGGERSLLDILTGVTPYVRPVVACPDGPLADALRDRRVERERVPGTDGSLRLHPWRTPLAVAQMLGAALATRRIARRRGATLIHANSIRAGLIAMLARWLGAPPVVAHLRDRLPPSRVSALTLALVGRADAIVANSRYTAARLDPSIGAHVLANPVDLARFSPEAIDRQAARAALGVGDDDYVAIVVAQITPWKGQRTALEAIAAVRQTHPRGRLLLVGEAKFVSKATRYDNHAYLAELQQLVERQGLGSAVRFLGERADIPAVMRAADVLLVPSWEEPFGRTVIEAMAMGLPVIATDVGGPAEVIEAGVTGVLAPPRDPAQWTEAILRLLEDVGFSRALAAAGRRRSADFGLDVHAAHLAEIYGKVLGCELERAVGRRPAFVRSPIAGSPTEAAA